MGKSVSLKETRRKFLQFLAGSPLLTLELRHNLYDCPLAVRDGEAQTSYNVFDDLKKGGDLITSPEQALDVMDFEAVARAVLPPAHFGYLSTGVDDDGTVRANRKGFKRFQIRARRLVDVRKVDTSVQLFGTPWDSPIVLAPTGANKAFNPLGEIATAKAARSKGHLLILATSSNTSVEDVVAARGGPVWFQLFPTDVWDVTRGLVRRAQSAGCPVLVLTVDQSGGSNRETLARFARRDPRRCSECHESGFAGYAKNRPMFSGLDVSKVKDVDPKFMDWDFVKRLKDLTTMKLVIKGILTREDAQLAVENGVDGIIVSNHGGRSVSSDRSTIETVSEVLEGTNGRIPVLIDGGFRRGTDVFKALALGANAICIGRPYLWGLAAFGQPGIEAVLDIMRSELRMIMRQAGTTSIDKITKSYLVGPSS